MGLIFNFSLLLAFSCNNVIYFQNSRSKHILSLVPRENASSEVSGESDFEAEEGMLAHVNDAESSEAPSINSSLERLNISDSTIEDINVDDDDRNSNTSLDEDRNMSPSLLDNGDNIDPGNEQQFNFTLPSISSLPTLSPISNVPSVTPSFILNEINNSPQPSPQISVSTPKPTRTPKTRADRRKKNPVNTNNRPRSMAKKKLELDFDWSKGRFQYCAELEPDVFKTPQPAGKTSLDYFLDFFSDDLFEDICQSTNMYAIQEKGLAINLTVEELRNFLAIEVIMGIVSMPSYLDYWCIDTRYPLVADVMSLKRYQTIRRYLHFVDNNYTDSDPYFKIRPFFEKIRQNCLKIEEESRFSIDEMVIPYKGTKAGKKRQYNPRKPRKWGFKNLVRAGASGIIYDFFLYAGNDLFEECYFTPEEESLGWGAKAVLRLSKTIKKKPCIIYFDNFFSSLELIHHLRHEYGIFSLGTMRSNRLRSAGNKLKTDKVLKTKGRGAFSQVVCNKNKLSVLKWNDNKCVILASSYADAHPTTKVKRYCKVQKRKIDVEYPNVVKHYNAHMGGVDLADMLIALYRTEMKSKRWYLSIFSQLLDICVNNAWLTYRRDNSRGGAKKHKSLKKFRLEIYKALLQKGKVVQDCDVRDLSENEKIKKVKRARPVDDVRYDKIDHFPDQGEDYGRCTYCKKGLTKVLCLKCKIKLCFVKGRNCFFNYHHK